MKEIRVNYVDTSVPIINGEIQDEKMKYVQDILSKYYDVKITKNDPDVIFCDIYGNDFIKYDCIKVGFCVEEYAPNFNIYDYVISLFDDFVFKDRILCLKFPAYLSICREDYLALRNNKIETDFLQKKTGFCSFVQSNNDGADKARIDFFHELSKYKIVDSGGKVENNVGGPVDNKLEFESKHKFSISFFNGRNFTLQDRPLGAFAAQSIPIYWGNPDIGKVYNEKAFINCHRYNNFSEVIEYIKEIDNNDDLYLKMIKEPVFAEETSLYEEEKKLEDFLINIIENGSIQRSGIYWNKVFEKYEYYGRKKIMGTTIFINKFRHITRAHFFSKPGKIIKRIILKVIHGNEKRKAYRKI